MTYINGLPSGDGRRMIAGASPRSQQESPYAPSAPPPPPAPHSADPLSASCGDHLGWGERGIGTGGPPDRILSCQNSPRWFRVGSADGTVDIC